MAQTKTNTSKTVAKPQTQYLSIAISIMTIFYYAVIERQNIKNQLKYQDLEIKRLESEISSKVDDQVFQLILDDIREIKQDVKDLRKDITGS